MRLRSRRLTAAFLLALLSTAVFALELKSPDGDLMLTFDIKDAGEAKGCAVYAVAYEGNSVIAERRKVRRPTTAGGQIEIPLGQKHERPRFQSMKSRTLQFSGDHGTTLERSVIVVGIEGLLQGQSELGIAL